MHREPGADDVVGRDEELARLHHYLGSDDALGPMLIVSHCFVGDPPAGLEYLALDIIGEGDDNVPVRFTLSGGRGSNSKAVWDPPPEIEQPTLRKGDKNADGWVEYIQLLLNEKLGAGLEVDGDFGPATQRAVDRFQKQFDIQEDRIVGNQTWAVLRGEEPVPASTDGRAPHTYFEGGAEARWLGEGDNGTGYDRGTDVVSLRLVSVGTQPIPEDKTARVRVMGNDANELFIGDIPIVEPDVVHPAGGAEYPLRIEGLEGFAGTGVHTIEAYLPAELGGDYVTLQVRIE